MFRLEDAERNCLKWDVYVTLKEGMPQCLNPRIDASLSTLQE